MENFVLEPPPQVAVASVSDYKSGCSEEPNRGFYRVYIQKINTKSSDEWKEKILVHEGYELSSQISFPASKKHFFVQY